MPTAPPRTRPSATAQGTERSRRAIQPIQPITSTLTTGKTNVRWVPRLNAAPLLRVSVKYTAPPSSRSGGWSDSLATTRYLVSTSASTITRAATVSAVTARRLARTGTEASTVDNAVPSLSAAPPTAYRSRRA